MPGLSIQMADPAPLQDATLQAAANDVLEGGVNSSLGLDGHGKSLSFLLLDAEIEIAGSK